MSPRPADEAEPRQLASLLSVSSDPNGGVRWRPAEFAAVWRHQLSVPVRAELNAAGTPPAEQGRSGAAELPSKAAVADPTIGHLLHHPQPPHELLDRLREFAKGAKDARDGGLPHEIARVLYFASIVAGLVRCGRRITSLGEESLRRGVDWSLGQEWIDPQTRALLLQGRERLGGSVPPP